MAGCYPHRSHISDGLQDEENVNSESHPSVIQIWNEFSNQQPKYKEEPIPTTFHFCDNENDANECAALVVAGIKRATSTSLWWFEKNGQRLPEPGDVYVITDWSGIAKAIVQTTRVDPVPFYQVTREYARIEGEGDQSLEYWRRTHWDYYTREMQPFRESPFEEMIIICEQFETVWKRNSP